MENFIFCAVAVWNRMEFRLTLKICFMKISQGSKSASAEMWTLRKWNAGDMLEHVLFISFSWHSNIQWLEERSCKTVLTLEKYFVWKRHFLLYLVLLWHKYRYINVIERHLFFFRLNEFAVAKYCFWGGKSVVST